MLRMMMTQNESWISTFGEEDDRNVILDSRLSGNDMLRGNDELRMNDTSGVFSIFLAYDLAFPEYFLILVFHVSVAH